MKIDQDNFLNPIACKSYLQEVEIKEIHFSPSFRKKAEKWVTRIKSTIIKEAMKLQYKKVKKLNKLLVNSYHNWVVQVYKVAQLGKDKSVGYGKPLKIWNKGRVLNTFGLTRWRLETIRILRGINTYQPKKLKRIYIPKPDGTERPLSIPSWFDKIIQGLIGDTIECQVETTISQNELQAYGFRKGFKTADAIQKLQVYALRGKHQTLIEFDLEKFYDTIPHDKLLDTIGMIDEVTKSNIEIMLKTESLDLKGTVTKPEKGTPQGGAISPSLANLYAVNKIMLKFKGISKSKLIMYADDGIIVCDKTEPPTTALGHLEKIVQEAGLKIKESKTKIINGESFNFCGFEITRGKGIKLKKDMIKKCKKECTELIKDKSIPTKKNH